MAAHKPLISIVVPAYNEEMVLEIFFRRILRFSGFSPIPNAKSFSSMMAVATGRSRLSILFATMIPRVASVNLSRNFGKEIAMTAGLDHAAGDAVVVIDADLQDPPEVIPALSAWRQGFDVVYARRTVRDGETG